MTLREQVCYKGTIQSAKSIQVQCLDCGRGCTCTKPAPPLWLIISGRNVRGGQLGGGCLNMCLFALRSRPFTAPLFDWDHFCSKLKLELWVTRWCACIHVGCSVCKLAGLNAYADHQNPYRVALHGKTAYVGQTACWACWADSIWGLDHQPLHRLTPFLLQWYLFVTRTSYHQKSCDLEWWMTCCGDFVVKSGVHAEAD